MWGTSLALESDLSLNPNFNTFCPCTNYIISLSLHFLRSSATSEGCGVKGGYQTFPAQELWSIRTFVNTEMPEGQSSLAFLAVTWRTADLELPSESLVLSH